MYVTIELDELQCLILYIGKEVVVSYEVEHAWPSKFEEER
jgi:hypothetical protein